MTRAEFEALHDDCAKALREYTKAAQLCKLLGKLGSEYGNALPARASAVPLRSVQHSNDYLMNHE